VYSTEIRPGIWETIVRHSGSSENIDPVFGSSNMIFKCQHGIENVSVHLSELVDGWQKEMKNDNVIARLEKVHGILCVACKTNNNSVLQSFELFLERFNEVLKDSSTIPIQEYQPFERGFEYRISKDVLWVDTIQWKYIKIFHRPIYNELSQDDYDENSHQLRVAGKQQSFVKQILKVLDSLGCILLPLSHKDLPHYIPTCNSVLRQHQINCIVRSQRQKKSGQVWLVGDAAELPAARKVLIDLQKSYTNCFSISDKKLQRLRVIPQKQKRLRKALGMRSPTVFIYFFEAQKEVIVKSFFESDIVGALNQHKVVLKDKFMCSWFARRVEELFRINVTVCRENSSILCLPQNSSQVLSWIETEKKLLCHHPAFVIRNEVDEGELWGKYQCILLEKNSSGRTIYGPKAKAKKFFLSFYKKQFINNL